MNCSDEGTQTESGFTFTYRRSGDYVTITASVATPDNTWVGIGFSPDMLMVSLKMIIIYMHCSVNLQENMKVILVELCICREFFIHRLNIYHIYIMQFVRVFKTIAPQPNTDVGVGGVFNGQNFIDDRFIRIDIRVCATLY